MTGRKAASHKVMADAEGNRYRFFCEASGIAVYTTSPIRADSPEEELRIAWECEAKEHFNYCAVCGRWICDTMYNAEMLQCVDCSPWQEKPKYCNRCGKKIDTPGKYCSGCGMKLHYGEVVV